MVGAEDALQDLPAHVVGQHPVVVGRRPRGVREVRDPDVRAQVGEHPRDQGQVVVLHQGPDRRARRPRVLRQRLGERPVVGAERLPLPARRPARTAAGSACRRACGARTTTWSSPPSCTPGGRWPAGCRACAPPSRPASRRGRGGPACRARAARSASLSAAQTHRTSPWSATEESPDTRPPPPRRAVSRPPASSVNDTGPRLEAMRPAVADLRHGAGYAPVAKPLGWPPRVRGRVRRDGLL